MKIFFWIIPGIIALISCDGKNKDDFEKITDFPATIGNEWVYESQTILNIHESPTSEKVIDADTLNLSIRLKVEKDTLLNDTMNVIQFISTIEDSTIEENDRTSILYFFIDNQGFKAYAGSNSGGHVFAKKKVFRNLSNKLLPFNIFGPEMYGDDEFWVFEPVPRLNLKLPVEMHSKWTYTTPYAPLYLQIDKEVIGYETVKIDNHSFSCYKISWIYVENKFFDETRITDWIAKEGLIKRLYVSARFKFNVSENEPYANGQITETILLKEFAFADK